MSCENLEIARDTKRRKVMVDMVQEETRDWTALPNDMLLVILGRLPLLDHLSFRSVCKDWRSASKQCPPENQPLAQPYWVMFSNKKRLTDTAWEFGDSLTRRHYTVNIPELSATKCLLSAHGWLLLFSSQHVSLFFLNPFSRARIDLPWSSEFTSLTEPEGSGEVPLFAVSTAPTNTHCTVFAITRIDKKNMKMHICCRGEGTWTILRSKYNKTMFAPIMNVVYSQGCLYWVDERRNIRAFKDKVGGWIRLKRPKHLEREDGKHQFLSYLLEQEGEAVMCLYSYWLGDSFYKKGNKHHVVLEWLEGKNESVKMTVLRYEEEKYHQDLVCFDGNAIRHVPVGLPLDAFHNGSWCVASDSEDEHGNKLFSWHFQRGPNACDHDVHCEFENSVWIRPKWIQPSPSIAWIASPNCCENRF